MERDSLLWSCGIELGLTYSTPILITTLPSLEAPFGPQIDSIVECSVTTFHNNEALQGGAISGSKQQSPSAVSSIIVHFSQMRPNRKDCGRSLSP